MANHTTTTITPRYHDAIVDWQKKNFPELEILERHWDDHFKGQPPFQLVAKIGDLRTDSVEVGQYAGRKRFERAKEMVGNAFFSARDIIRAQCSTGFAISNSGYVLVRSDQDRSNRRKS